MSKVTPSGAILIDKQPGITSFNSLSAVKRLVGTKKVGHSGTLDSFASGLLVVLVGNMTKLASIVEAQTKVYSGVAIMGTQTNTLDPTGNVILQTAIPTLEALQKALPKFVGNILQTPPAFSAIKIDGKRSSDLVRAGKEVFLKSRPITVSKFILSNYNSTTREVGFYIECSKGTYVRKLLLDLFNEVDSCCHLKRLRRERVGNFKVEDAAVIESDTKEIKLISELELVSLVDLIYTVKIQDSFFSKLTYGKKINIADFKSSNLDLSNTTNMEKIKQGTLLALEYENRLAAIIEPILNSNNSNKLEFAYKYNGASR